MSAPSVVSVELTEAERRLIKSALLSFVTEFGHDEADVLRAAQELLAKFEKLD